MDQGLRSRGLTGFETRRFRVLLLTMVALFAAHALADTGRTDLVLGPIGVAVLAATLFVLGGHRWVFWTALALSLAPIGLLLHPTLSPGVADLAGSRFHAPLFCFVAAFVTTEVLQSERADEDTVVGSICAYLFIALAFASLYALIETWQPGAFASESPARGVFAELVYFSLVTMTTLGYGDITPLAPAAMSLVTLQTVIGVLFPTFIVARIVSLYTVGGGRPFEESHLGVKRPERFELLVFAELLAILAYPFVEVPATLLGMRIILTLLLLSALYAVSDRPWAWLLGTVFVVLSAVGRWWPAGGASWVPTASLACETLFLLTVCAGLVRLVALENTVSRDALLASVALYLLMGITWAAAYSLVGALEPGSIVTADGSAASAAETLYYSFMTLTTTGFGDVVPASGVAKRLANAESFVGIFYPAVLIARLVSLYETT